VALIIIQGLQIYLLPALHMTSLRLIGS